MEMMMNRFLEKIKFNEYTYCWEWIACKFKTGYGQFYLNGKVRRSHRVAYELFKDKIPMGMQIDHLCRNRACCNPEHLEIVTPKENCRRGNTGLHHRVKTHCPQGHEYNKENTVKYNNLRRCITCEKERLHRNWLNRNINIEYND